MPQILSPVCNMLYTHSELGAWGVEALPHPPGAKTPITPQRITDIPPI